MTASIITGVVPILITPFDSQGRIDSDSLQSLIDFNINSGVHGIGIANGSEIFKLNESERELVTKIVIDHVAGRVPVIINTGAHGTSLAIQYSKLAQEQGADGLMIIPPHFMPVGPKQVAEYYEAIDSQITIPIFLQDIPQSPISPSLALELAKKCQNISYIKVETSPSAMKVSQMVDATKDVLTIFGGAGGSYFIEEMRRGAKGTMPFCSQPKAFVEVWNLFQKGDEKEAINMFNKYIVPMNRLEIQTNDE
jgi:4-hydroxy-tetrahydrodipicolinate synthase